MVNIELSMNKRLLLILSMLLMVNIAKGQFVKATFGLTGGGIASQMITDIPLAKPAYISGYGGLFTTLNFGGMLGVRAGNSAISPASKIESWQPVSPRSLPSVALLLQL